MKRQILLPLTGGDRESLQRLWEQIPEESRIDLALQYARLIAEAARDVTSLQQQESNDDLNNR